MSTLGDNSIDGVYFDTNLKATEAHFITDSDEYALITFSPHIHRIIKPMQSINQSLPNKNIKNVIKVSFTKQKISGSMGMHAGHVKMEFASKPIYWHSKELTPACYQLQAQTQKLIQKTLYGELTFIDKILIDIGNTYYSGRVYEKIINNLHQLPYKIWNFSYEVLRQLKKIIIMLALKGPKYIYFHISRFNNKRLLSGITLFVIRFTIFTTGVILGINLTLLALLFQILKLQN